MKEEIKNKILELCKGKNWDWKSHVESVVKYSKMLAKKMNADEEVCEISAWLHDIIKIRDQKENHHIIGAEEAVNLLKKYKYPDDKIQKIKHCILTHSSDKNYVPETKEAKILATADSLSHFDNLLELAHYAISIKKESAKECKKTLLRKYENSWNKILIPEAKEMIKSKYDAIKLLLN